MSPASAFGWLVGRFPPLPRPNPHRRRGRLAVEELEPRTVPAQLDPTGELSAFASGLIGLPANVTDQSTGSVFGPATTGLTTKESTFARAGLRQDPLAVASAFSDTFFQFTAAPGMFVSFVGVTRAERDGTTFADASARIQTHGVRMEIVPEFFENRWDPVEVSIWDLSNIPPDGTATRRTGSIGLSPGDFSLADDWSIDVNAVGPGVVTRVAQIGDELTLDLDVTAESFTTSTESTASAQVSVAYQVFLRTAPIDLQAGSIVVSNGAPRSSDSVTIPYTVDDALGFLAAYGVTATGELYWANGLTPLGTPIKRFDLDVTAGAHEMVYKHTDFADIPSRPAGANALVCKLKLNSSEIRDRFPINDTGVGFVPLPDLVAGPIFNQKFTYTVSNPGGLLQAAKAVSHPITPAEVIRFGTVQQTWGELDLTSGEHQLDIDFLDWVHFVNPTHDFAGLAVELDPGREVAEFNELNNLSALSPVLVDFRADGLGPNPDGTGVRLSYTLRNTITPWLVEHGVSVRVSWASLFTPLGTGLRFTLHPDLGPNTLTVTADELVRLGVPPPGATGLVAALDPDDAYVEPNEGNNTAGMFADTTAPLLTRFYVTFGDGQRYDLATAARLNLPWKITGLQAEFSRPVYASRDSLTLTGRPLSGTIGTGGGETGSGGVVGGIGSSLAITGFGGSGTNVLTWTLAGITLDQVTAALATGGDFAIRDRLGIAASPTRTSFGFGVAVGDVTGDQRVLSNDRTAMRQLISARGYSLFYDLNGDGVVDAADLTILQNQLGTGLA